MMTTAAPPIDRARDTRACVVMFILNGRRRRGHVLNGELASLEPVIEAPPIGSVLMAVPIPVWQEL